MMMMMLLLMMMMMLKMMMIGDADDAEDAADDADVAGDADPGPLEEQQDEEIRVQSISEEVQRHEEQKTQKL